MDKELLKESINQVKKSLDTATENKRLAEHHMEEANIILIALKAELKK